MNEDLRTFYDLAQRTRAKLLDWFETLPPGAIAEQEEGFAYGSIAAIQSHAAATYLWWVGTVGMGEEETDVCATDVRALREAFALVDSAMDRALNSFTDLDAPFVWKSRSA